MAKIRVQWNIQPLNSQQSSNGNIFYQCYMYHSTKIIGHSLVTCINPYPTAFPYGNGMVLHFYQQQESSMTKTVHKVINKGLKTYV